jgi:hypothetical protein
MTMRFLTDSTPISYRSPGSCRRAWAGGQAPEDVAANRVEGVREDRKLNPHVLEIAQRDMAPHIPVAVGEPPHRGGLGRSRPRSRQTSSRMSSTVTMPTVRPYCRTTAIELRWRCSSASRSSSGGLREDRRRGSPTRRGVGPSVHAGERASLWTTPRTRSGYVLDRISRVWPRDTALQPPRRLRGVDRDHGRNRVITLELPARRWKRRRASPPSLVEAIHRSATGDDDLQSGAGLLIQDAGVEQSIALATLVSPARTAR